MTNIYVLFKGVTCEEPCLNCYIYMYGVMIDGKISGGINREGVQYYNNLFDKLKSNGPHSLTPIICELPNYIFPYSKLKLCQLEQVQAWRRM